MKPKNQANKLIILIVAGFIFCTLFLYLTSWSNPAEKDTIQIKQDTLNTEQIQKVLKDQLKKQNAKIDSLLNKK